MFANDHHVNFDALRMHVDLSHFIVVFSRAPTRPDAPGPPARRRPAIARSEKFGNLSKFWALPLQNAVCPFPHLIQLGENTQHGVDGRRFSAKRRWS